MIQNTTDTIMGVIETVIANASADVDPGIGRLRIKWDRGLIREAISRELDALATVAPDEVESLRDRLAMAALPGAQARVWDDRDADKLPADFSEAVIAVAAYRQADAMRKVRQCSPDEIGVLLKDLATPEALRPEGAKL